MKNITHLVPVIAGLVVLFSIAPGWGQPVCASPGCNPTASDLIGNTAGGTGALANVSTAAGGIENTAFGEVALGKNTSGAANTAVGDGALASNITGNSNTAAGFDALEFNGDGSNNTAIGVFALQHNTSGNDNTATGVDALQNNGTGANNTATGGAALALNTTGTSNTASGFQALLNNDAGNNNTAIGAKALKKSLGTKNIGIGYQAGVTLMNGNNNIYIGNQGAGDEFQTIRIGTAQTQTFIAGINGAIVANGAPVEIDTTTGQLGVAGFSSVRYKQDIAPMGSRSEKVLDLHPVTFVYKGDARHVTHFGLVAEEVAAVFPELVTHTATGDVQAVRYQELIAMLLNELQRLRQELTELRAQGRGAEAALTTLAK